MLEQQRFYPARQKDAFPFSFTSCTEAEATWRERLPKVIELSKAMAIAELEIKGEYNSSGMIRSSLRTAHAAFRATRSPASRLISCACTPRQPTSTASS